jgi:hypothetical protein
MNTRPGEPGAPGAAGVEVHGLLFGGGAAGAAAGAPQTPGTPGFIAGAVIPGAGVEVHAVGPEPGVAVGARGATGAEGDVPRATGEFVQGEAPGTGAGAPGAVANPGVSADAIPGVALGVGGDGGAPHRGTAAVVAGASGGSVMIDDEAGDEAVADGAFEREERERRE